MLTPAQKAAETRWVRKYFRDTYPRTARTAEYILRNPKATSNEVYDNVPEVDTPAGVAAVRANLSRPGAYSALARACHFAR